jgi:hypothetical protein
MKRYIPVATQARRAISAVIQKENPVNSKNIDISGNVVSRSLRRPKVSMVYIAGRAKTQLVIPQPSDVMRAMRWLKPALRNMTPQNWHKENLWAQIPGTDIPRSYVLTAW